MGPRNYNATKSMTPVFAKINGAAAAARGTGRRCIIFALSLVFSLSQLRENWTDENGPVPIVKLQPEQCKMLWFAGMSLARLSTCSSGGGFTSYEDMYAAALESAVKQAKQTLQPVLVLNEMSTSGKNHSETLLGKFASSRGAEVLSMDSLSFQDDVDGGWNVEEDNPHRIGPFVRLDVPLLISKHKLFDRPGICQRYALYTDTDVIFPNPIERSDLEAATSLLAVDGEKMIAYGADMWQKEKSVNTGVAFIDVPRFEAEIPSLIEFLRKSKREFEHFDQGWINAYFDRRKFRGKRAYLDFFWNWKIYWYLDPANWKDVMIVHFHGPKPGRGLEDIVFRNKALAEPAYRRFVRWAKTRDKGRTAKKAYDIVEEARRSAAAWYPLACPA